MFIKCKFKRDGFILYESIVALMVTIMTLGILQQSLQILKTIQNTSFRDQLRWHITQERIQDLIGPAQIRRIDKDGQHMVFSNPHYQKILVLEQYHKNMLRFTTATDGGHEPMITELNKLKIEKIQNLVIITTVNKAGQTSMLCVNNDS